MEIWGVQVPIDYVVVGGAALIAATVVLVSLVYRRYRDSRLWDALTDELLGKVGALHPEIEDLPSLDDIGHVVEEHTDVVRSRVTALEHSLRALNLITGILALLPVAGAVIALYSEHSNLALQLDVIGLVVFIVTKGGLWLLTMALIPAAKAVPGWVGGGVVSYYVQRWLKNREKQREPAEKK